MSIFTLFTCICSLFPFIYLFNLHSNGYPLPLPPYTASHIWFLLSPQSGRVPFEYLWTLTLLVSAQLVSSFPNEVRRGSQIRGRVWRDKQHLQGHPWLQLYGDPRGEWVAHVLHIWCGLGPPFLCSLVAGSVTSGFPSAANSILTFHLVKEVPFPSGPPTPSFQDPCQAPSCI